jgi:hypothetical protein
MPTPRGRATPAMLADLLVSKYCDHLPLYRQCEIADDVDNAADKPPVIDPQLIVRARKLVEDRTV